MSIDKFRKKKYKVGLIGRVAEEFPLYDGQTVKTRSLKKILEIYYNEEVYIVDTYDYKKNILNIFLKTFLCFIKCEKIVISISHNGRKFFFPLIYYINKIFKKKVYHSLIGGRLDIYIKKKPRWLKYLNSFNSNWVESIHLSENLKALGLKNSTYFQNFKDLKRFKPNKSVGNAGEFRFCIFSRVQEKKGITEAISAINEATRIFEGQFKISLDIYGPVDDDYSDKFFTLVNSSESVNYKGSISHNDSTKTINRYYMLLFPTKYFNEGIPGTIIDSFASSVPVIASDWKYCRDLVNDGITGDIFKFGSYEHFLECLINSIKEPKRIDAMRIKCYKQSQKYLIPEAIKFLKKELEDENYSSNT